MAYSILQTVKGTIERLVHLPMDKVINKYKLEEMMKTLNSDS